MKVKRQSKILEIIQSRVIETQEDLITALEESGFAVTQATVSRDIKELRLIKTLDHAGTYRYAVVKADNEHISGRFHSIFQEAVRSIDFACNLVVVKCLPGMAQAACA
ncbi:MAG: arginine repressor, partial [Clostridia bacterium]|nr:arginine repressor [Clostridia bacterium]